MKVQQFGLVVGLGMKAKDFVIVRRPKLAKITKHPAIGFANYERRMNSGQSVLQSINKSISGLVNAPLLECGCHHTLLEDTVANRRRLRDRAASNISLCKSVAAIVLFDQLVLAAYLWNSSETRRPTSERPQA